MLLLIMFAFRPMCGNQHEAPRIENGLLPTIRNLASQAAPFPAWSLTHDYRHCRSYEGGAWPRTHLERL